MDNKKLLLGLTVLATPFVVENLVETNVASANQKKVVNSSEYVLNKPAKAYVTANDAAKRVKQKTTYQAGTYYVYNQSKGMVNISRASGKAGSWINPVDNPNVKVESISTSTYKTTRQTSKSTVAETTVTKGKNLTLVPPKSGQYSLLKSTTSYVNAIDASKKVNAKGTVSAGNYYIYREYKGMLNVSRVQGKVGSWINPSTTVVEDLNKTISREEPKTNSTKGGTTTNISTVGNKTNTGTFTLTNSTESYVNAADASKKVNARGKVSAGIYHIFREYKGMLNISRAQGKPGSWINPGVVTTTDVKTTAGAEETPKIPAPTQGRNTKDKTAGNKTNTGLFTLTNPTESYVNAADASKKINARGKVAAGNYYIYREYKGMLNISKVQGKVGAWINPSVKVEFIPGAPDPSKLNDSNSLPINATNLGWYRSEEAKRNNTKQIISNYKKYLLTKYNATSYSLSENIDRIKFNNGLNFTLKFEEASRVGNRIVDTVVLLKPTGEKSDILFNI